MIAIAEAANALAALLERTSRAGSYTYDIVGVKRWILGSGGRDGNCEACVDNADLGWIDQDGLFDAGDFDVDEPPAHQHCTCGIEFGERRKRMYN